MGFFFSRSLNTSVFIGGQSCRDMRCVSQNTEWSLSLSFSPSIGEKIPGFPGSCLGLDEVCIISLLNLPLVFRVFFQVWRCSSCTVDPGSWCSTLLFSQVELSLFLKKENTAENRVRSGLRNQRCKYNFSITWASSNKTTSDLSVTWCLWGSEQRCHRSCSASIPYATVALWTCATNANKTTWQNNPALYSRIQMILFFPFHDRLECFISVLYWVAS